MARYSDKVVFPTSRYADTKSKRARVIENSRIHFKSMGFNFSLRKDENTYNVLGAEITVKGHSEFRILAQWKTTEQPELHFVVQKRTAKRTGRSRKWRPLEVSMSAPYRDPDNNYVLHNTEDQIFATYQHQNTVPTAAQFVELIADAESKLDGEAAAEEAHRIAARNARLIASAWDSRMNDMQLLVRLVADGGNGQALAQEILDRVATS